ncbi:MAG: transglutaminase-like domain-containing protein [Bacteroidota bacterium]
MKDSELKAMISLLDDDDPRVETQIRNRLLEMGQEIVPRLEVEWEQQEDEIQSRIEDIIHLIQSTDTIKALRKWIADDGPDLFTGWALLTQYHFPELDYDVYRGHISRLVNKIWLEFRPDMTVTERMSVINKMIFNRERFTPNRRSVFEPTNHYINGLLEKKKGSPLSLGALYLILGEALDLPLQGIMLPKYFAITYQEAEKDFYIDPFNQGLFFTRSDLTKYLDQANVKNKDPYFQPTSKVTILRGLVEVLLEGFNRKKNTQKVNDLIRLKSYMDLDNPFDY